MNQKFLVNDGDEFNSSNYPELLTDLVTIVKGTANTPNAFRADILISLTKNHSLKMEWILANREFATLVTCGALPIGKIESLFEASGKNSSFTHQFEAYLKEIFQ